MHAMNLPNKLTVARCILTVLFVALMTYANPICYIVAYALFAVAAITDYYDGKIARERNLVTNFGKLFDPIADKVLLVAGFIMLMKIPELHIPGWAIVAIIAREFLITGARTLAAAEGVIVAANKWGKLKTLIQMAYIFTFLFFAILSQAANDYQTIADMLPGGHETFTYYLGITSLTAIVFVSIYTVSSGVQFARQNWKLLGLDKMS
jgi:CDP-diacylglycerol--glycerol-3-phosphate 3-phosphatidyltransferase